MNYRKQNRPEVIEAVNEINHQYRHRPGFRRIMTLISTNARFIKWIIALWVLYVLTKLISLTNNFLCLTTRFKKFNVPFKNFGKKISV